MARLLEPRAIERVVRLYLALSSYYDRISHHGATELQSNPAATGGRWRLRRESLRALEASLELTEIAIAQQEMMSGRGVLRTIGERVRARTAASLFSCSSNQPCRANHVAGQAVDIPIFHAMSSNELLQRNVVVARLMESANGGLLDVTIRNSVSFRSVNLNVRFHNGRWTWATWRPVHGGFEPRWRDFPRVAGDEPPSRHMHFATVLRGLRDQLALRIVELCDTVPNSGLDICVSTGDGRRR